MADRPVSNTPMDTQVSNPQPTSVTKPIQSVSFASPTAPYVPNDIGEANLNEEAGLHSTPYEQLHAHVANLTAMVYHLLDRIRGVEGKKAPPMEQEPLVIGGRNAPAVSPTDPDNKLHDETTTG